LYGKQQLVRPQQILHLTATHIRCAETRVHFLTTKSFSRY
jgi:hypothetical protein